MSRSEIFISYSHQDREWLDKLKLFLKPLERNGLLQIWDDGRIRTGADWKSEIIAALSRARVGVLLISQPFLASDFIADEELPRILRAAQSEGVTIYPIVVAHSTYHRSPLSRFQAANDPQKPLESLSVPEQNKILAT